MIVLVVTKLIQLVFPNHVHAASPLTPANCIDTAIGCIPITSETGFLAFFVTWAIGIAGGIAFLLIVYAGFQIMTSTGNPDRLKAGRELMTSAVAGLLMLIFSVFILRVVGVDILGIPGL